MRLGLCASLLLAIFLPLVAVADEVPAWLRERRIIGQNDLEPIENTKDTPIYEQARVVARVEKKGNGASICTGSRVGENLFLTNYHCFDFLPCDQMQFHLGYERELSVDSQLLFTCKEVLSTSLALDYALYEVEYFGTVGSIGIAKTYAYDNLRLAIPDNDEVGISRTFTIPSKGELSDLKVALKFTHPAVSDLQITLKSPRGTEVTLQDRSGSFGSNIEQTYDFTLFHVLRGENPLGVWTLHIKDLESANVGTLDQVVFSVTTGQTEPSQRPEPEVTPSDYPVATLWDGPLTIGEPLMVVSHPAGRFKEIDRGPDCKLMTTKAEEQSERETIRHSCDTEGGSSGSPVLDRASGRIIALHWGGQDDFNMAVPITAVLDDIRQHVAPEVLAELHVEGSAEQR